MWFECVYDDDPYEREFEIADFERRLRRERQFDIFDSEQSTARYEPRVDVLHVNITLKVCKNGYVVLFTNFMRI